MHAIFNLLLSKSLKFNVKFLIKVNEESVNDALYGQIKKYTRILKSDIILISNGERPVVSNSVPVIK
jgi:hypothetical protein